MLSPANRARVSRVLALGLAALLLPAAGASAQEPQACFEKLPTELVTLNLRDANVQTTLRLLAQHYRVNMVVTDEVAGSVTLDFYRVPVRDVFQSIIESADLRCIVQGVALRVSSARRIREEERARAEVSLELKRREAENRRQEAEAQRQIAEAETKKLELEALTRRGPIKEEIIRLKYTDAVEVANTLRAILGLAKREAAGQLAPPPGTIPVNIPEPTPVQTTGPAPVPGVIAAPTRPGPSPEAFTQGLAVEPHPPTNSIFIRFYENDLARIKKLVTEQLDVPVLQIHIAAQMVEVTRNALEQLGIQWGGAFIGQPVPGHSPALIGQGFGSGLITGTGTGVHGTFTRNPNFTGSTLLPITPATALPVGGNLVNLPTSTLPTAAPAALNALFGIVGQNYNLNLAIQALESQGKAKSLAEPKIVTGENLKAHIERGTEVPFVSTSGLGTTQVQFKNAVLSLDVTPSVIREEPQNKIRMKVLVTNDEPDFASILPGTSNPPLRKRRAETEVVVREGERLVIGGVLQDTTSRTIRQVPLLGSIPILGWLFKQREISGSTNDLIVILTPSVLNPAEAIKR
ncbi:MAG TPA: secretin N-terminal domain-containing protein [Methylomirabilota bacterium]|nr:secretin N-terminal domain-containing protein [Methylomirabilota bacterium]